MAKKATKKKSNVPAVVTPQPSAGAIVAATENLPAETSDAAPPAPVVLSNRIVTKRVLTYQQFKFGASDTVCVTIVSDIWKGQKLKEDGENREPPHLARVIVYNLETAETDGVVKEMIIPAVLRSELEKQFPKEKTNKDARDHLGQPFDDNKAPGYYGETLVIRSYPKRTGKAYRTFDIAQVDIKP